MKGKIVFTFKPNNVGTSSIKQDVHIKDISIKVLVKTFANFATTITPTQKDAEKFVAAVYCAVSGKVPPSQFLASFDEQEESADE